MARKGAKYTWGRGGVLSQFINHIQYIGVPGQLAEPGFQALLEGQKMGANLTLGVGIGKYEVPEGGSQGKKRLFCWTSKLTL